MTFTTNYLKYLNALTASQIKFEHSSSYFEINNLVRLTITTTVTRYKRDYATFNSNKLVRKDKESPIGYTGLIREKPEQLEILRPDIYKSEPLEFAVINNISH